jgi:MGT family glycosyltransferase
VATIGVIHSPLSGHVNPLARLSRVLSRHGHRIVAWAPDGYRDVIERDGVELRALGAPFGGSPMTDFAQLAAVKASAAAAGGVAACAEALHAEEADLVVYDAMSLAGRVAARWLGVPAVASNAGAWPLLPREPQQPAVAARAPAPAARDVAALESARASLARDWGFELGGVVDILDNAGDLNLAYTTPAILGREGAPGWRLIGPLLDPVPRAAPPQERRPLVLFSLGTVFTDRLDLFRAAAEAFAGEPIDVLVATAGRVADEAIGPLPDNVTIERRLGVQREILSRADVFVSHCGAGSLHESLAAGVPVAGMPQFTDQPFWAARAEALGAGAEVVPQTADALRATVVRLLEDPAPRQRAEELAEHLAAYDGAAVAAAAVDELLG